MVSQLTEAMIANGVVLATVLASDPGHARKIGPAWLARPPIAAAVIIPLFADRPPANASSVAAELAGAAAGLPGSALLRTVLVPGRRGAAKIIPIQEVSGLSDGEVPDVRASPRLVHRNTPTAPPQSWRRTGASCSPATCCARITRTPGGSDRRSCRPG
jgi:hypothetical protein